MTLKTTAVHLINEGVYLVKYPCISWPHSSKIYVNGTLVESSNRSFTVSNLDEIEEVFETKPQIIHYVNEDGIMKTIDGYNSLSDYLSNRGYKDDEGDLCFDNLEDEYAYKKFIKTWKPVYGPTETIRRSIEVEVTEVRTSSGDPDINSLWNSTTLENQHKLYSLNRLDFAIKTLKQYCNENNLNLLNPSHSGLRYAKINGEYVFNENFKFDVNFIGTLEQAIAEKERITKMINDAIVLHFAKKTKTNLKCVADVLNDLYLIRDNVNSKTKNDIYKIVNKVIKTIEQEMIEQ